MLTLNKDKYQEMLPWAFKMERTRFTEILV